MHIHASAGDFSRDGYTVVRGLFTPGVVAAALADLERIVATPAATDPRNMRCRYHLHPGSGTQLLEALDPITDLSPAAKAMADSPEAQAVLSELLGDRVHLFKDKAVLKPPGARGYPLHQDYIHWPLFPKSFTTLVVALDAADTSNGCIEVFPGTHTRGVLSPLDGDFHDLPDTVVRGVAPRAVALAPGDAVIFGCLLPHRSEANLSGGPRRQLYLSYNAARDGGEQRAAHYRDFHRWLRSRYGEYGAGELIFN